MGIPGLPRPGQEVFSLHGSGQTGVHRFVCNETIKPDMDILFFPSLESTNTRAEELAAGGAKSGTVVWALEQTAGLGQYGRSFASPSGGLYCSLILRPDMEIAEFSLVTLAAGLGCVEVIMEKMPGLQPKMKWPNDVYIRGKKVAGILSRALPPRPGSGPVVIIGVGINVNSAVHDFPAAIRKKITTLYTVTGSRSDLNSILTVVINAILEKVRLLKTDKHKLLAEWDRHDYLRGKSIQWVTPLQTIYGQGTGILPDGRYGLRERSGEVHAVAGGSLELYDDPAE